MFPIASSTVTGSSAVYAASFTNIPQTFTHLQLRLFARGTQAQTNNFVLIQFNNDVLGTNYWAHWIEGNGSAVSSNGDASAATYAVSTYMPGNNALASVYGASITDIYDYTSTTKTKALRSVGGFDNNGVGGVVSSYSGVWFKSPIEAISVLTVYMANAAVGSRVDLYGVSISSATGA